MYCKKCGKLLEQNELFCSACGAKSEELEISQSEIFDSIAAEKPMSQKPKKWLDILALCGFIFASTGVGIFLIIVFAGLIGWGKVYLFGGYTVTAAFTIISIILMMLGALILTIKLILILIKYLNGFPVKKVTRTISLVLIALSLGFSIWGFIDAGATADRYSRSNTLFDAYIDADCSSPWATYDSTYIKIDSNPYDIEGGSTTYILSATSAIKKLNSYFEVPSYVYDDMMSTRAVDGRQTYSNSKITIYWRYHPDTGLEVTYTLD